MDVDKNLFLLNKYLADKQLSIYERLYVIKIAKISKNIEELHDNLVWEYRLLNIK